MNAHTNDRFSFYIVFCDSNPSIGNRRTANIVKSTIQLYASAAWAGSVAKINIKFFLLLVSKCRRWFHQLIQKHAVSSKLSISFRWGVPRTVYIHFETFYSLFCVEIVDWSQSVENQGKSKCIDFNQSTDNYWNHTILGKCIECQNKWHAHYFGVRISFGYWIVGMLSDGTNISRWWYSVDSNLYQYAATISRRWSVEFFFHVYSSLWTTFKCAINLCFIFFSSKDFGLPSYQEAITDQEIDDSLQCIVDSFSQLYNK